MYTKGRKKRAWYPCSNSLFQGLALILSSKENKWILIPMMIKNIKILHYPYMLWIVDAARASVYLEQKFARMH